MDLVSRFASAVFVTSLVIGISSGFAPAQNVGQATVWTPNPANISQGVKEGDVILSAPPEVCNTSTGQPNGAFLGTMAAPATVPPTVKSQGFGVTVGTVTPGALPCELMVPITTSANATVGPMRLTLSAANAATGGTSQAVGFATITVTSSQAGPIPDGLAPQVDADYYVLSYQKASDNYGTRVAQQYFVVIPTIGNNTGFSLQLSSIGFTGAKTGNTNPAIVQGTLLYGEDYSARNIIYRALVSASLLAAGASPFFHSANPKANFAAVAALIGGPLLGSFSQEFPDNTVKQLARLGASDVMTDQNIIPNNSEASFVAFVERDSVCPPGNSGSDDDKAVCGTWTKHYDPATVKSKLGDITIVGDLRPAFLERIKVTVSTSGAAPATAAGAATPGAGAPGAGAPGGGGAPAATAPAPAATAPPATAPPTTAAPTTPAPTTPAPTKAPSTTAPAGAPAKP
jgi:hypothetical protein